MYSKKTFSLVFLGLLCGIVIVQSFVPFLGLIPIPPFNPTIIPITVIVGAVTLGTFEGSIIGGVWGILVLIRAFVMPTSPIDPIVFINPLISVLPRILIGTCSGLTFQLLSRFDKTKLLSFVISGVVGSAVNTILVLGLIYLIYKEPAATVLCAGDISKLLPLILGIVVTNGIPEAVVAGIITPVICKPLIILKKMRVK